MYHRSPHNAAFTRRLETVPEGIRKSIMSDAAALVARTGDFVVRQGDDNRQFFLLAYGYLFITQTSADGDEAILRVITPGEVFGFMPAYVASEYPESAVAACDCKLYAWPNMWVERYSRGFPDFAYELVQQLTSQVNQLQLHTHLLATRSACEKIAGVLVGLADRAGLDTDRGKEIAFPITRAQIAQMSGTTLHTASRALRAWQNEGIVSGTRRKIIIVDTVRLLEVVHRG